MSARVAPTRVNLLRARRELARVQRGAALIRRKREALVAELFRLARPAVGVRARITAAATAAGEALRGALAHDGADTLDAMAWPLRDPPVTIRPAQVWGIAVSDVLERAPLVRTAGARGHAPALTSRAAAATADRYERLADLLVEAAPREQRVRRLGDAVASTTRHLRTLEQRVAPRLAQEVASVRRALEEREREERIRLKHVQRGRGVR